jgi:ribosomal protein S18 acetylase RimI-like enzyme
MDRVHYQLKPNANDSPCGEALFWDMEPLAASWGVHARGLIDVEIDEPQRRQGLATFLLGEAMREMRNHGVAFVEAQVEHANAAALDLLAKLGFQEVEHGIVFRKPV